MKLSELISEAVKLLESEGDLEVQAHDNFGLTGLSLEEASGFLDDWDMPDGFKFVRVLDCR